MRKFRGMKLKKDEEEELRLEKVIIEKRGRGEQIERYETQMKEMNKGDEG